MNQIATIQGGAGRSLTASDMREQVNLVQEVMKAVMKPDVHYGIIPGCKQPSLYKAGSEVLLATFRIAVSVHVEDLSTDDCIRYRVRTVGTHAPSGIVVGEGIGECSSNEAKYKWRRCYIQKEFDTTPESRRRIKYIEWNGKVYENMEVRTDPSDVANTILKMAKKRAQIDMTLTATAASDCFSQDLEDLPEELRERDGDDQRPQRSAARRGAESAGDQGRADSPERQKLIADLTAVADNGLAALTKAWGELSEDARRAVGAEFGAMKRRAEAVGP